MKEQFIKWYGLDLSEWNTGIAPDNWGWFRIIIPYQKLFYQARKYHDIAFSRWWDRNDLIKANEMFYRMCLRVSKTYLQKKIAWLYFFLVKSYWYKYFNYKN
jgi:hypothetical protein